MGQNCTKTSLHLRSILQGGSFLHEKKKTIKYKQILKDKEKKNYWLRVKVTDNSDS